MFKGRKSDQNAKIQKLVCLEEEKYQTKIPKTRDWSAWRKKNVRPKCQNPEIGLLGGRKMSDQNAKIQK
ncbi:MAG: hypothetical protein LUF92_05370, partial [Clostridiales bacterium]|nr:hypothetical protein [Clostridiales bacterium]